MHCKSVIFRLAKIIGGGVGGGGGAKAMLNAVSFLSYAETFRPTPILNPHLPLTTPYHPAQDVLLTLSEGLVNNVANQIA